MAGRPRKPAVKAEEITPAVKAEEILRPEVLDTSDLPGGNQPQLEIGEQPAPKKPRGRPAGSASGSSSARGKSLESIEALLVGIHGGVAGLLNMPELAIDEKESATLAKALDAVASQYKIRLDGKQGAVAGLIGALVTVYGPRVVLIVMRKKMEGAAANG